MATKTMARAVPKGRRPGKKLRKLAAVRPAQRRAPRAADTALVSTLTARLQTTIPSGVRKVLEVRAGDQLEYIINDHRVEVRKAATPDEDPALGHFLTLLERDIASDTPHIRSMPRDLLRRVHELTRGMEIDHDAPFGDEDAE